MNKRYLSGRFFGSAATIALMLWVAATGPLYAQTRAAEPIKGSERLANGVYAVLAQAPSPEALPKTDTPATVLMYNQVYSQSGVKEPPRYVALDAVHYVPLVLAKPPVAEKDERGWTMLNIALAKEHIKALEELTRAHLGGEVAIVIGGEIVTIHKVRSVITDGKARITRCEDDACQSLLLKLTR